MEVCSDKDNYLRAVCFVLAIADDAVWNFEDGNVVVVDVDDDRTCWCGLWMKERWRGGRVRSTYEWVAKAVDVDG